VSFKATREGFKCYCKTLNFGIFIGWTNRSAVRDVLELRSSRKFTTRYYREFAKVVSSQNKGHTNNTGFTVF